MKKFLTLLLAAAMVFSLTACGTTPNPADNNTQGNEQDVTPIEAPQIAELYSEDFDYTDGVGNGGHYTYRVPQITANTQGAADINKSIEETYSPIVKEVLDNVSGGFSLSCLYVTWATYQYGSILSLVVSCGWDGDVNHYDVYLYDIASGQQLTTVDLLKALNVDETTFLDAVRQTAAKRFDDQYSDIPEGAGDALAERRDWTLSDDNINMDVPTYADAAGKLHVVLPIGSIAGADSYEQVLTLEGIGG